MTNNTINQQRVYIIDGCRTPFLKAKGIGSFSAADLATYAASALINRLPFAPTDLDEVIAGCMIPSENEANIGRIIALRVGCGKKVPGWTVQRNCASGMQAIDCAFKDIACGRHHLVLTGGTEAMSRAPLIYRPEVVSWFATMMKTKMPLKRLKHLMSLPLAAMLRPIITLLHGLTDPINGLNMGQTAEILAHRFDITRLQMDQFAYNSHKRLALAYDQSDMAKELVTIYDQKGNIYASDNGLRRDTTLQKLAQLKPMFDKKYGNVTAGNSSQVTDGACFLVLASEQAVAQYDLPILAEIKAIQWAGCDPAQMGLGPIHAATPILQRHKLSLDDIDYWEINEAFAAQVLACLQAWNNDDYCRLELGLESALGKISSDRLNIDGGAVATGHPVGASGARITLHLAKVLYRKQAKRGMAAICIGGGQGGALLLQRA